MDEDFEIIESRTKTPVCVTRIPKIIHQTWETNEVPERWKNAEIEWRKFCDVYGFEYKLWTAEDRRNLVKDKHGWYLETFDALPMNVQRADTWRYFALYDEGGVYIDLDFVPKHRNMHALLEYYNNIDTSVAVAKSATAAHYKGEVLTNACMMSEKGAPFWETVWEEMKQPLSNGSLSRRVLGSIPYFNVIFGTGPGLINVSMTKYLQTETAKTHPFVKIPCDFISCGFEWDPKPFDTQESAVTLLAGSSWHTKSMAIYRYISRAIHEKDTVYCVVTGCLIIVILILILLYLLK